MAKTTNAAEFNTFIGGLITEASPLTFPQNASLDESNFVLNRDGSRNRRLGMDFEQGFVLQNGESDLAPAGDLAVTSHNWENAGGELGRWICVVQTGRTIKFYDAAFAALSQGLIFSYNFPAILPNQKLSYAVVDGILVIATGERDIYIFEYEAGVITVSTKKLLTRDLFGVEDKFLGLDLRQGTDISTRPSALTNEHLYNLRNQTWATPRITWHSNVSTDTISTFIAVSGDEFPSNADAVTAALSKRADVEPSTSDRFRAEDIFYNPIGTFSAAKGYFIIDAMARGSSRMQEMMKLQERYPQLDYEITSLPFDETPGGASVICEYAGRVWFSGFSGQLILGDEHSPRMASYVFFSQLVDSPADIINCFQEGDPTSPEEPELVDSDGGFIRIEGAYGICRLVNVGNAVVVVAANGVWMIQGGSDYGFTATNYLVTKISDHGSTAPNSIVVVDNTFMYWGEDGIYHLTRNQYGDYVANNLTEKTIQTFYEAISSTSILNATGFYDSYDKKVKWLYNTLTNDQTGVVELVFDIALGAFYPAKLGVLVDGLIPMAVGSVKVPPFHLMDNVDEVTVSGVLVTSLASPVTVTTQVKAAAIRETKYIVLTNQTGPVYTFASYSDTSFIDWFSYNGVGVDAPAFLLTGYLAGEDFQREKWAPFITLHFRKTETGFEESEGGDWLPVNPSSCLVQSQWAWANSVNSGKWGRVWQGYRHRRHFTPQNVGDPFDNGYAVVETRNKLRGNGKVLSLFMQTEPAKDLHIYGWSMVVDVNGTV